MRIVPINSVINFLNQDSIAASIQGSPVTALPLVAGGIYLLAKMINEYAKKSEDDLLQFLFSEIQGGFEVCKRFYKSLSLTLHPDGHSGESQENIMLLTEATVNINHAMSLVQRREDSRLARNNSLINVERLEEVFKKIEDEKVEPLKKMRVLEKSIYAVLLAHAKRLSPQTHQSLVRLYGQVLQYLINWGVEHKKEWILKKMSKFTTHCIALEGDIKKADAGAAFEAALRVNIPVDGMDYLNVERIVEEATRQQNKRDKDANVRKKGTKIGAGLSVATTTFFVLTGPAGWLSAVLVMASAAAVAKLQVAASEAKEDAYNSDRTIYLEKFCADCLGYGSKVLMAVQAELEDCRYRLDAKEKAKKAIKIGRDSLIAERSRLTEANENSELLRSIDEYLKELDEKENRFFTQSEREFLQSIGCNIENESLTQEEADGLRKQYLDEGALDPDEIAFLQSSVRQMPRLGPYHEEEGALEFRKMNPGNWTGSKTNEFLLIGSNNEYESLTLKEAGGLRKQYLDVGALSPDEIVLLKLFARQGTSLIDYHQSQNVFGEKNAGNRSAGNKTGEEDELVSDDSCSYKQ